MLRASGHVEINRSVGDVFKYAEDPHKQHEWQPGLHQVRVNGDKTTEVRKTMGRHVEHDVLLSDRQENKKLSHRGDATSHDGSFERHMMFEDMGGNKTKVTMELNIDTKGVLGAARPVVERMVQREVNNDLGHLKDMLEAHSDMHSAIGKLNKHS
jgi:uncharacterized membrane protein